MMCPGSDGGPAVKCVAQYKVVNERTIQVPVPDQTTVTVNGIPYDKSKPFEIAMMDMDKQFQQNGIKLYYFVEFTFKSISSQFAYNNEEKPLMIDTDFKWDKGNDFAVFRKNANLTCRF
jgi:cytochrome c1